MKQDWNDQVALISGAGSEHGIGMAKREALARWLPPVELAVMNRIKRALDPNGLLSRGRVLVSDFPE